ncbi:MAG: molybdenum ABC transporter ATP-binding protein [Methylobacter sp.]|jgi:molybdate transport system ATP-binding protein
MTTIQARFRLDYGDFQLDVDLQLPGTGITVLFGHSGSGKTTLLRCIAGLQRAQQGFLGINGSIWQDSERDLFLPTHQRPLGYVFQEANLFPHLTVRDNLHYGLKRIKQNSGAVKLEHTIELLGIGHLMERMPERLSGGERQRVAIARALALNPEILLMDEPLASLDFKRKQEILPFLSRLHQQLDIPVLYVTHAQQEVAQLADYLVIMADGREIASGLPADTLTRLDMPLAQDKQQAATVWQVTVAEHEADYHLTRVAFAGGSLSLPTVDAEVGTPLRVQIYARDVSIALEAPTATSILNVLPATITGIADDHSGQSVVQLRLPRMATETAPGSPRHFLHPWRSEVSQSVGNRCDQVGTQPLLAHITCKSALLLGLQVGMPVYAQIKGTSILN